MSDESVYAFWKQKIDGAFPSIRAIREIGRCDVNAAFMFYASAIIASEMLLLTTALDAHAKAWQAARFRIVQKGEGEWAEPTEATVERIP